MTAPSDIVNVKSSLEESNQPSIDQEVGSLSGRTVTTESSYKSKKKFMAGVGPGMFDGLAEFLVSATVFAVGAGVTLAVGLSIGYATDDWKKAGTAFKVGAVGTVLATVGVYVSAKKSH